MTASGQDHVSVPSPNESSRIDVTASGTASGTALADRGDSSDQPTALCAATVNWYDVAFVSPSMRHTVDAHSRWSPPGRTVTR